MTIPETPDDCELFLNLLLITSVYSAIDLASVLEDNSSCVGAVKFNVTRSNGCQGRAFFRRTRLLQ